MPPGQSQRREQLIGLGPRIQPAQEKESSSPAGMCVGGNQAHFWVLHKRVEGIPIWLLRSTLHEFVCWDGESRCLRSLNRALNTDGKVPQLCFGKVGGNTRHQFVECAFCIPKPCLSFSHPVKRVSVNSSGGSTAFRFEPERPGGETVCSNPPVSVRHPFPST